MGADIYDKYKAARDVIDASDKAVGGGLKKLMFDGPQVTFANNCGCILNLCSFACIGYVKQTLTSTENAQPGTLEQFFMFFPVALMSNIVCGMAQRFSVTQLLC